jgi:cell wall-associated NlpC family hydrolase
MGKRVRAETTNCVPALRFNGKTAHETPMKKSIFISALIVPLRLLSGYNDLPEMIPATTPVSGSPVTATAPPEAPKGAPPGTARSATLDPSAIRNFDRQPEAVQNLLRAALQLAGQNLTYTYGSANPDKGGMDCSGIIYYLLTEAGMDNVPRSSSEQYVWLRKIDRFRAVLSREENSFEFDDLEPGDLLFWSGTYEINRDPPITHTMIYLGVEKKTGRRLMVGASNGRSYNGKRRWGVSVFDFRMPRARRTASEKGALQPRFVGYGSIPGIRD